MVVPHEVGFSECRRFLDSNDKVFWGYALDMLMGRHGHKPLSDYLGREGAQLMRGNTVETGTPLCSGEQDRSNPSSPQRASSLGSEWASVFTIIGNVNGEADRSHTRASYCAPDCF